MVVQRKNHRAEKKQRPSVSPALRSSETKRSVHQAGVVNCESHRRARARDGERGDPAHAGVAVKSFFTSYFYRSAFVVLYLCVINFAATLYYRTYFSIARLGDARR